MWKCPNCPLMHQNPEMHARHLKEFPKCLETTLKPTNLGWQGIELSGIPTIAYKSDNKIPMKLWGQTKPAPDQEAFKVEFRLKQ